MKETQFEIYNLKFAIEKNHPKQECRGVRRGHVSTKPDGLNMTEQCVTPSPSKGDSSIINY